MITLYMPHVLNDGISVKQEGFRWFLVANFFSDVAYRATWHMAGVLDRP